MGEVSRLVMGGSRWGRHLNHEPFDDAVKRRASVCQPEEMDRKDGGTGVGVGVGVGAGGGACVLGEGSRSSSQQMLFLRSGTLSLSASCDSPKQSDTKPIYSEIQLSANPMLPC